MAITFQDIKPEVLCGVNYKEAPLFIDKRGHLKEHLEATLNNLCSKRKECHSIVRFDKEGDIVGIIETKPDQGIMIGVDEKSINIVSHSITSFDLFEDEIPQAILAILEFNERKNILLIGMMFKCNFQIPKDKKLIESFKAKYFNLKEDNLPNFKFKAESIDRLGLELRFEHDSITRYLIVRADEKDKNNEISVSLDNRIEDKIEVKNTNFIKDFFCKTSLNYFMDTIVNEFAKEFIEMRLIKTNG